MNNFKKYLSYKDSGSPWFPSIPAHWEVLSNRYIFDLIKSQVGKKSNQYKLLSLTLNGVIERDMENPSGKFPAEFDTYQEVKKGDFIFCLFDVEETPRTVGLSEYDGMITGAYTIFRNRLAQNANYLYYFFLSLDEKKRLKPLYKGLRNTISKENFYSFKTPLPPLPEQTAIANFLDKKTAEIKEFIALKEKTIALLKERKMAIINRAVTKGLDPTVEMRDSGIEWLGEIPKHWEVKKLKYIVSKVGSGVTPSGGASVYVNEGIPLLRSQNVHFGYLDLSDVAFITDKEHHKMKGSRVQNGDVLLNITGGSIGRCHFVEKDLGEANVNQHVCIIRPTKKIESKYLNLLLSSDLGQRQVWSHQYGGGREGLNFPSIKGFEFSIPPKEERIHIIEKIEQRMFEFDTLINQAQTEISLIKEYQQSLISEVVTGKVDVTEENVIPVK